MGKVELPDFDDMYTLVSAMQSISIKKAKLETAIAEIQAKTIRTVMNDDSYLMKGKIPSVAYATATWGYTGLHDELLIKRQELAECDAVLESSKRLLDFYKIKIEVWRTISANERSAIV